MSKVQAPLITFNVLSGKIYCTLESHGQKNPFAKSLLYIFRMFGKWKDYRTRRTTKTKIGED